jgi:hypothetical protein
MAPSFTIILFRIIKGLERRLSPQPFDALGWCYLVRSPYSWSMNRTLQPG